MDAADGVVGVLGGREATDDVSDSAGRNLAGGGT